MRAGIVGVTLAGSAAAPAGAGLGDVLGRGHHEHAMTDEHYGSDLARTYTKYNALPMGESALRSAGWTKHNTECNPHLGYVWTEESSGATKCKPVKLYTTAGGQPSGVGTIILSYYDADALPAEQQKWATDEPMVGLSSYSDKPVAHVDVAFRSGDILCNGETNDDVLGDTLIVNPGGKNSKTIATTEAQSEAEGWRRGSCFDSMGWHRFLDTSLENGQLSWEAANLFPVVAMYHEGVVNAIFFASWLNQVSIPFVSYNEWEPLALNDKNMCANTCDHDCTFAGTPQGDSWSTMHIYFNDPKSITCDKNLECSLTWPFRGSCCDASTVSV